ncbi:MAG: gliding motility-associated C-terminal domain-containing protein [Saprospiraceae bacterium]|nr:gliding motility-associated C-terminal domain-containing protein [Saprospiraceae bacterium]
MQHSAALCFRTTFKFFYALLSVLWGAAQVQAQCPTVEAVMIDACGTEFLNEFIVINSGGGFNTSDIQLDYDINNNIIGPENNDVNTDNNNVPPGTPCGISTGNAGSFTGCSNVIAVGDGVDIPANSIVIFQNSTGAANNLYNATALCGAGQCVYVVASSCTRSAGGFSNGPGGGTRTTVFSINGSCNQTITYNLASSTGGNGAYFLPLANGGTGSYGNAGCFVPPVSPAPPPPVINPIANVSTCGSYILPAITGTNLPANTAYFTGTNGTGTQYNPGDEITTTTTLYAYAQIGPVGCSDQEQFTITITPGPTANQPNDVTACAGTNVSVTLTGSPGATLSWTNDNTAIGLTSSGIGNFSFPAANVSMTETATITVTPTQGMCMGTPVTFTITINPRPQVIDPPNMTACAGDPVEVIFSSNNGNSPTYNWTNSNTNIGLSASGSGDISFTAANVATNQNATITVTATENGCPGSPQTFTISVGPVPNMNQPVDVTVCGGAPVSVNFSGGLPGTVYAWTNDNTAIGLGAMGTGNISFTSANPTDQQVATITVVPTLGACAGLARTFTITINPRPTVDDPANLTVCGGEPVDVAFNSPNSGALFTWTNTNTSIGLAGSGSGDISFTANNVATTQTGTINVIPTLNGCTGTAQNFTITVTPSPTINQVFNVLFCGGAQVNVPFSGTAGATFSWTNDNPNIGLSDSGTGNISFTAGTPATTQVANITVTPSLNGCDGAPQTFTITILATPTMDDPADQTYCGGQPASVIFTGAGNGAGYTWTNNNPGIGLGANGSGDINFTTANNTATGTITVTPFLNGCQGVSQTFTITVALSPTISPPPNLTLCGGQAVTVVFSATSGATINWTNNNPAIGLPASGTGLTIDFTAANPATQQVATITATPSVGNCIGTPVSFSITVNPAPTVADPIDVTVCPGFNVNVNFNGSPGATFFWSNNNVNTGLDPGGVGNISFTSANVSSTETSIVTVTPSANGCSGPVQTFSITVDTLPDVGLPADQSVCAGAPVAVAFSGTAGATFNWTNDNPAIGLAASGSGNISFTSASVASPQTGVITVTPFANGCSGAPQTFDLTVSPVATVNPPADATVCAGDQVDVIFGGTPGATFNWTNTNTAVGLAASGAGNISFTSANVSAIETGVVTVTPTANGCPGAPVSFNIAVAPSPSLTPEADLSACGGQSVAVNFTTSPGTTLNWTNSNPAIGLGASGSGDISFTAAAVGATTTGTIIVSPVIGSCNGPVDTFEISIVTAPTLATPADQSACAGTGISVNFNGSPGATFNWTNSNPAIGLPTSGSGNISFTGANVATTQTGAISVTPTLGACTGPTVNFDLTVNPGVTAAIMGGNTICMGDNTTLTASGGSQYVWDNSATDSAITVAPLATTTYVVNVSNAAGCSETDSIVVTVNQPSITNIQQSSCNPADTGIAVVTLTNLAGCDSVVTTITTLLPTDTTNLSNATCDPNGAGTFTQILSNQFGCDSVVINMVIFDPANIDTTLIALNTCDPNQAGTTQLLLSGSDGCDSLVITTTSLLPTNTTNLSASTCDPNQAGTFTQVLTNQFGCDSTVVTTVTLAPTDTTNLSGATCDPNGAGTFTQTLSNQFGCDSVVITTILFDPANIDTTLIALNTCDPNQTGTTQLLLSGSDGCDSLVITTTSLLPNSTTNLSASTCDPNAAGTFTQVLTNQFGCDSTVITTVTFDPNSLDTTLLALTTCDPGQTGVFTQVFTNQSGCDSTVVTTVSLLPSNTTNLSETTCDPNAAGTFTEVFPNQFGCDSTVITTVTFDPALIDTLLAVGSTCDPAQTGVFTETFTNSSGCLSVLITTVALLPTDTTTLFDNTCDPNAAGTFTQVFPNQFGCDSLVVLVVDLLPSNTTNLTDFTCDPAQTGTFTQVLPNQFGCDSTVVTTVVFDPSAIDSTFLNATTCDPAQVGFSSVTLNGADGCDSVIVTYTLFDPVLCTVSAFVNTAAAACPGVDDGTATLVVTGGQAPFDYTWTDGAGNSGSGQIAAVNTPELITGLAAGTFTVSITGSAGPQATVVSGEVLTGAGVSVDAAAILNNNGFAVSCNGLADGSAQANATGGTLPYQYLWQNGATTALAENLEAGVYGLTVTDDKGCTAAASVQVTEPLPLQLFAEAAPVFCGDSTAEVTLVTAGGAGARVVEIDGQLFNGVLAALGAGTHDIVVSDANGCSADTTLTLSVPPVPLLFLPADTTIRLGEILSVTAQTNLDTWASLTWNPVPDTSCADCLSQTWAPEATQLYTLTIVDTAGCVAVAEMRVVVRKDVDIYIPNVFSPDDDGYNDFWQIDAGPTVTDLVNLRIFDRWGDQVYLWDEPIPADTWSGWDGKIGGKAVEVGVYVYYIEVLLVNGEKHIRKGDLTVLKRR